jgi:hypothetical protein
MYDLLLQVPIDVHSVSICDISAEIELAKLLRITKLIVRDKALTQHRHCFEVEATDCLNWGAGIEL